ncbi:PXMP2/4 family protein 4-like [Zootermopsis nevadensis]|uniref:PXMP2/4 family protein 4-like n=1 Tax=Zootermopsis nevadensis TaxID=136037 RepID=UPI000B8E8F6D|nr:PXMP2/4 family protein 4-like [Zootermopsis nevadensis]
MNFFVVISKKIPFRGLAKFPTKGTIIKKINVRIYLTKLSDFTTRYPLIRGMITYSFTWPISNLCQQAIRGSNEWDFAEALRFCLYGSCFVAPTLYGWLRLAANMWPQLNYRSAIAKALVEQISYTPFAMVCFFFIMTLLEGKSIGQASAEVRVKFFPTYQVGACVWPVLQLINYTVVSEKNRVPYVGMCSLLWTCFLAYMKQLEAQKLEKIQAERKLEAEEKATTHSYVILLQ